MADIERTNGQVTQVAAPVPWDSSKFADLANKLIATWPTMPDLSTDPDLTKLAVKLAEVSQTAADAKAAYDAKLPQVKAETDAAISLAEANKAAGMAGIQAMHLPEAITAPMLRGLDADIEAARANQAKALSNLKGQLDSAEQSVRNVQAQVEQLRASKLNAATSQFDTLMRTELPLALASIGRQFAYNAPKQAGSTRRASTGDAAGTHRGGGRATRVQITGFDINKLTAHNVMVQGAPITVAQADNLVGHEAIATDLCKVLGVPFGRGYAGNGSQANREASRSLEAVGFTLTKLS